jgi:hypothetical protein
VPRRHAPYRVDLILSISWRSPSVTVVTEGGLRWCPLPSAFWWEPPALAGGRSGLWWEPPALAGGAGLQSSGKAFNYAMGFSPGDFSIPALKRRSKSNFYRSAEALLPPHKCGGSHREVHFQRPGAWCPRFASVFWTLTWAEATTTEVMECGDS